MSLLTREIPSSSASETLPWDADAKDFDDIIAHSEDEAPFAGAEAALRRIEA